MPYKLEDFFLKADNKALMDVALDGFGLMQKDEANNDVVVTAGHRRLPAKAFDVIDPETGQKVGTQERQGEIVQFAIHVVGDISYFDEAANTMIDVPGWHVNVRSSDPILNDAIKASDVLLLNPPATPHNKFA